MGRTDCEIKVVLRLVAWVLVLSITQLSSRWFEVAAQKRFPDAFNFLTERDFRLIFAFRVPGRS